MQPGNTRGEGDLHQPEKNSYSKTERTLYKLEWDVAVLYTIKNSNVFEFYIIQSYSAIA